MLVANNNNNGLGRGLEGEESLAQNQPTTRNEMNERMKCGAGADFRGEWKRITCRKNPPEMPQTDE